MNASPATIVFIDPIKIKNWFLSFSSIRSRPITAAWLAPKDGRKVHKGADNIEATIVG